MSKKATPKKKYLYYTQYRTEINPKARWYNFKEPFISIPVRKYKIMAEDLGKPEDE